MAPTTPEDLKEACNKEKDSRIVRRMTAVNMVCMNGQTIEHTADSLMRSEGWVSFWIGRFREGGMDALRDLQRSGRPPKVEPKKILRIISETDSKTIPRKLKKDIKAKLNVTYHITLIRRIMKRMNLTPKTSQIVHENKPDEKEVRKWQCSAKRRISCLKRQGFAIVIQDESFFTHDPKTGKKYWSPKGEPIVTKYNGRHSKAVVYGAISTDRRRFFRTYSSFNAPMFLTYIKALQRHFGKVCVIMDGASPHTSRMVRDFVQDNPNIKTMYLPTATPELSAMEQYWHQSKRDVLVSEYYATYGEMRRALSKYLRTTPTDLDVMAYIGRKSLVFKNF